MLHQAIFLATCNANERGDLCAKMPHAAWHILSEIKYIDVIELERGPYWRNIGRVSFLHVYGPHNILFAVTCMRYAARNVFPRRPLFVTIFLFLGNYTSTIVNNHSTQQQTMAISVKNVHLFNRKRKNYTDILQFLTTTKTGR